MNHVTQLSDSGDCGVACLAIFCHVPYKRVMESVPSDVIPHGLWLPEVLHAVEKITTKVPSLTYYNDQKIQQLSRYEFPQEMAIYGVLRLEANSAFHYVCCDGSYLYDPMLPDKITLDHAKLDYHSGWAIIARISF